MIGDNLIKAVIAVVVFILATSALGYWLEDELTMATTWVVNKIGFFGLGLILLVTDTLVTPFPPDILLLVIAKSPLAEQWQSYVLILGMISCLAGMLGWGIGRWLGRFEFVKRTFGDFKAEHREFIRRYGFWAVVIGSITPFPFSVTCWTAGMLELRWITVLAAAISFRIPRFFFYYWLITSAGNWI
ncbi:YqaA family protein [Nitrosomonas halophila]|uniref:Membrane protein YqaA, SNARE-associated domain n=1 Tax=Nitrosomonas halophila TaxID=44576 RepID=A0A1H3MJK5_9PROT|nr:VTT domain-containing protein [Nitrosomonas halophila]SDY76820.1 membrane protein YqaA, SNARE-associated domain [Nitrosomonas halophila]